MMKTIGIDISMSGDILPTETLFHISAETFRFWKEQPRIEFPLDRGNAKYRRRWRRRNIPNSQREAAKR